MKSCKFFFVMWIFRAKCSSRLRSASATDGIFVERMYSSGSDSPSLMDCAKFTNVLRTEAFSEVVSGSKPRSPRTALISGNSRLPLSSSSYLENALRASLQSRSLSSSAMRSPSSATHCRLRSRSHSAVCAVWLTRAAATLFKLACFAPGPGTAASCVSFSIILARAIGFQTFETFCAHSCCSGVCTTFCLSIFPSVISAFFFLAVPYASFCLHIT
mmetsp:Transcript_138527/g.442768  ORF Transcript_138527/g.442768 Transcript_138527/m.442768 type:complete len:216 (-) Transcript_138527:926-1573(-)